MYALKEITERTLIVRTFKLPHNSFRVISNRMATIKWLTDEYLRQFRRNPKYDVTLMVSDMIQRFSLKVIMSRPIFIGHTDGL